MTHLVLRTAHRHRRCGSNSCSLGSTSLDQQLKQAGQCAVSSMMPDSSRSLAVRVALIGRVGQQVAERQPRPLAKECG